MLNFVLTRVRAVISLGSPAARNVRRDEPVFWILFAR